MMRVNKTNGKNYLHPSCGEEWDIPMVRPRITRRPRVDRIYLREADIRDPLGRAFLTIRKTTKEKNIF